MKRPASLSALLLGLSLVTVASTSLAEETSAADNGPENGNGRVRLVAQVADGTGTGSGTSSPTAAPADGATTPTAPQATVTLGGTTPAVKDQAQAAAEEPKAKPKPRPFAGTQVFITTSMSTATVFRGQQQYSNPTADSSLWLLPRFSINKEWQIRGRLIASYEFTNSDTSTYRNEPELSDTTLQLFYRGLPKIAEFQPAISANLGLPTSKASRARTMVVAPGLTAQVSRVFENVLGAEDIMILGSFGYSHPLYTNRQAEVVDPRNANVQQCVGGTACGDQLSGRLNPSDSILYMALLTGEWGHWSPAVMYLGSNQWTYTPKEVTEGQIIPGGSNAPIESGTPAPTRMSQSHYFSAWLDYNFNSWMTGEVGYWMRRSALAGDGKYANPFWDRYQDMRVYLGVNINIDNLIKSLEGSQSDGGIIRAKNTRQPMFTF